MRGILGGGHKPAGNGGEKAPDGPEVRPLATEALLGEEERGQSSNGRDTLAGRDRAARRRAGQRALAHDLAAGALQQPEGSRCPLAGFPVAVTES